LSHGVKSGSTGSAHRRDRLLHDRKEADDLKEATAQKAAMTKAKVPLLNAAETAVNANAGFRAVSIYPQLQNGNPMAEVTLLQGTTFKKVMEKLD
jgi:type II secretory pathway component PulF